MDDKIDMPTEGSVDALSGLHRELAALLNRHSAENGSDTPDFILADYMMSCLWAFDNAVLRRKEWYENE